MPPTPCPRHRSPAFRGYIPALFENTAGKPDAREQVEFGVEADPAGARPSSAGTGSANPGAQVDADVGAGTRAGAGAGAGSGAGAGADASSATPAPLYLRLVNRNQWPAKVPRLRAEVTAFMVQMERLSRRLMAYLALSLGLDASYFDATFLDRPNVQMKVCKCVRPNQPAPSPAQALRGP